jgi:hypothetical protein
MSLQHHRDLHWKWSDEDFERRRASWGTVELVPGGRGPLPLWGMVEGGRVHLAPRLTSKAPGFRVEEPALRNAEENVVVSSKFTSIAAAGRSGTSVLARPVTATPPGTVDPVEFMNVPPKGASKMRRVPRLSADIARDEKWTLEHERTLRDSHGEKWIAVWQERVVCAADSEEEVRRRAAQELGVDRPAFVWNLGAADGLYASDSVSRVVLVRHEGRPQPPRPPPVDPSRARAMKWAMANWDSLLDKHPEKWVAIVEEAVVGVGDSRDAALSAAALHAPNATPICLFVEGVPRVYSCRD